MNVCRYKVNTAFVVAPKENTTLQYIYLIIFAKTAYPFMDDFTLFVDDIQYYR